MRLSLRPRALLQATLIVSCFLPCTVKADDAAQSAALQKLRKARAEAAHRQRRIIFNNDGCDAVYYAKEATPEALLRCRTTDLAGTQVDTINYCTWCSGFSMFTHDTKIGEIFTCTANPKDPRNTRDGFSMNTVPQLIAKGTDPLKIMVQWCHDHDKEIFWSFRMNDTHDSWGGWYSPYLFPKLKQEHPEWLIGSKGHRPKHGAPSAVDFGRPEIRDLAFRFTEEVCQNYDVDGVELDFLRHPSYFKRPAMGQDAGQEELDQMTDMVRRIRAMTEAEGLKRGRPILVGIRVHDSADANRAIGLDVTRWLEEGLVDVMTVGGYLRMNPWQTSVKLGHKYGVPVYPCLSESRLRDEAARKLRSLKECYRARASEAWSAGVDGVYMFNSFDPKSPLWSELGDKTSLKTQDKLYTTGARGLAVLKVWLPDGERFVNRTLLSPERPLTVKPGEAKTIEIPLGEEAIDAKPNVKLSLRVNDADPSSVAVRLNDQPLTDGTRSDNWLDFPVDPSRIVKGTNRVTIAVPKAGTPVKIEDLALWIRYPKN